MIEFFKQIKTKHPRILLFVLIVLYSFLIVMLFSTSTSFLYPLTNIDNINLDSNFFLYCGQEIVAGKTPYIDFYDHKGLYHMLINALGVILGGRYGIFLIQIVFLSITLYFLYLTVLLWSKKPLEPILAILFYSFFLFLMAGGNTEAEYLMPFITLSLYFYSKGIIKKDDKSFLIGSFFLGLEMGLSLNSRPTDAMWGGAIAIYYIVYWARYKKNLQLLYNVLIAILGLIIPFLVTIPWAIIQGFLKEMFIAVFLNNTSYLLEGIYDLQRIINQILILIVSGLIVSSYFVFKKKSQINYDILEMYFVCFLITLFCFLIIAKYTTYYWTTFSFLSTYLVYLISNSQIKEKVIKKLPLVPLTLILGFSIFFVTSYYSFGYFGFSYQTGITIQKAIDQIPKSNRNEEDFFAINCDPGVYMIAGVHTSFPYFCNQSWWGKSNPEVIIKTNQYLIESSPKWLLVGKDDSTMEDFGDIINQYYFPYDLVENTEFIVYLNINFQAITTIKNR